MTLTLSLPFSLRMTGAVPSPYSNQQISVWLRGLLALAWADGNFDEQEKALISDLTEIELAPKTELEGAAHIMPEAVAEGLGNDPKTAENFLRTAVMVAIADGTYSAAEDRLLQDYCTALNLQPAVLDSLRHTLTEISESGTVDRFADLGDDHYLPVLAPVQEWLDGLEVQDPRLARFLCKMIPPQCPFERDVVLFGRKIVHIPAMCKLNPLYEQLVGLRFRALSYLADDCGEDVTPYC
nr:Mo-dependent nitrogenase C-terminal domain-containing protein [Thermoleptolyngbya sp. C42_A2020_037]